jgi:hypothetical protein
MTIQSIVRRTLIVVAGVLSAGITLHGIYAAIAIDLRHDPVITGIYCLLPTLCFPVFLLVRPPRRTGMLLFVFACAFWAAYSALNWRTCSELGYCGSIASTVLQTMRTPLVLAFFSVVVILFIAAAVDRDSSSSRPQGRVR